MRRYIDGSGNNTDNYELPVGDGTTATDLHRAVLMNSNLSGNGFQYIDVKVAAYTETGDNVDPNLVATQGGTPGQHALKFQQFHQVFVIPSSFKSPVLNSHSSHLVLSDKVESDLAYS